MKGQARGVVMDRLCSPPASNILTNQTSRKGRLPFRYSAAGSSESSRKSQDLHSRAQFELTTTTSRPSLSPSSARMASQRLALNLQRSLRSRKALNAIQSPLRRYANPVTPSRTESTTLSNGLTVCRTDLCVDNSSRCADDGT